MVKDEDMTSPAESSSNRHRVIDSLPDSISVISKDHEFLEINRAGCMALGMKREDILGKKCHTLVHGLDHPLPDCPCRTAAETKKTGMATCKVNGSLCQLYVYPLLDEKGDVAEFTHVIRDISGSMRKDASLRESEDKYRTIFHFSPVSLWEEDISDLRSFIRELKRQGVTDFRSYSEDNPEFLKKAIPMIKVIDVNEKTLRLYEAETREELLGPVTMTFDQKSRDALEGLNKNVLAIAEGKRYFEHEGRVVTRRGKQIDIMISAYIPSETEPYLNMIVQLLDISSRKKAEEALRESEERFRGIFDNTSLGVYRTTPDGRILLANTALIRILGYDSLEELKSRNLEEQGFEPDYIRANFRQSLETYGKVTGLEASWKTRDGATIFIRENARVIKDETGKALYYEGTVEDITEHKSVEDELEKNRALLQGIIEGTTDAVYVKDIEGRYLLLNGAAQIFTGRKAEDVLGRDDAFLFSEDQAAAIKRNDCKILSDGKTVTLEEAATSFPDRGITFLTTKGPIFDKHGKPLGLFGIARDITDRKKTERELMILVDQKEFLLRELHHRVKNNLSLVGSLLSLESSKVTDEKSQNVFEEIQNRVFSISQIYEHLYKSDDISNVNLHQYIEKLSFSLYETYVSDSGLIHLIQNLEEINLDIKRATSLGLIVNELITNALKYAFPDNRTGAIRIGLREIDGMIDLSVSDNGIGLPAGFEIEKSDSFGLTEELGGSLSKGSGGGSTFRIRFKR